jgi:hypothetical protein
VQTPLRSPKDVSSAAYSAPMRYTKQLVGLAVLGVFAVGCGPSDGGGKAATSDAGAATASTEKKPRAETQQALPVAVTGPQEDVVASSDDPKLKVTPEPPNSASFTEKVEHKLREDVLSDIKVPGETSADCPKGVTQKANAVSVCNVTYEGAVIPYEIKISDSYKPGSIMTFYNAKPTKGLLVAKDAYDKLWSSYKSRSDASKLACQELPVAKAVEIESDTGLRCQYWGKYGGENHDGGYVSLGVKVSSFGVEFYEVR